MPFIQPTGIAVGSRINNVANLAKGFSNNDPTHKDLEPEISCQVKNIWVRGVDDSMHIFTKTWLPVTSVHSVVVFVHDILEHCERYHSLFVQFAIEGIEVQSFDLPGFGETGARADTRGITGGYNTLLKEIDSAINRASSTHSTKPLFLIGHGMGGALVLNYVCGLGQRINALAGVISSSPYLKPTLSGAGARFPSTYNRLSKWYPNISVKFQVLPEELTRNRAEQERHRSDGLIQESISLQCLGDMIYQGNKLLTKRWKQFPTPLPTLLLHGIGDTIASSHATSTLSARLLTLQPSNFVFKSWKGSKHDPHWDINANAVQNEYLHWIRDISRHFDKAPLEDSIVPSGIIKSVRSQEKSKTKGKGRHDDKDKATKSDDSKNKGQSKDNQKLQKDNKKLSSIQKLQEQEAEQQQEEQWSTMSKAPDPAVEKPEEIQDLKDLLCQQQLKQERAKAKRLEYDLDVDGGERSTLAAAKSSLTSDPEAGAPAPQAGATSFQTAEPEENNLEDVAALVAEPSEAEVVETGDQGIQVEEMDGSVVPFTTPSTHLEPAPEYMNQTDRVIAPSDNGTFQENNTLARLEGQETGQQLPDAQGGALDAHPMDARE